MAVRGAKKTTARNSRKRAGRTVKWTTTRPPAYLSERAQAEYTRLVKLLKANGTLEQTDHRLVELYAIDLDLLLTAQATLQRDGLTTETKEGRLMNHPSVTVVNSMTIRLKAIINDLGLCPAAHKHGGSIEEGKRDDPWGDLLNVVG